MGGWALAGDGGERRRSVSGVRNMVDVVGAVQVLSVPTAITLSVKC